MKHFRSIVGGLVVAGLVAVTAIPASAFYSNLGRDKSLAGALTKADLDILWKAIQSSAEKSADNKSTSWSNPATGAKGTVTPIRSFTKYNLPCRQMRIMTSDAKNTTPRPLMMNVCKTKDRGWLIAD